MGPDARTASSWRRLRRQRHQGERQQHAPRSGRSRAAARAGSRRPLPRAVAAGGKSGQMCRASCRARGRRAKSPGRSSRRRSARDNGRAGTLERDSYSWLSRSPRRNSVISTIARVSRADHRSRLYERTSSSRSNEHAWLFSGTAGTPRKVVEPALNHSRVRRGRVTNRVGTGGGERRAHHPRRPPQRCARLRRKVVDARVSWRSRRSTLDAISRMGREHPRATRRGTRPAGVLGLGVVADHPCDVRRDPNYIGRTGTSIPRSSPRL